MNSARPPGNFKMISCLNELDLCKLFLLNDNLTYTIIQLKRVRGGVGYQFTFDLCHIFSYSCALPIWIKEEKEEEKRITNKYGTSPDSRIMQRSTISAAASNIKSRALTLKRASTAYP